LVGASIFDSEYPTETAPSGSFSALKFWLQDEIRASNCQSRRLPALAYSYIEPVKRRNIRHRGNLKKQIRRSSGIKNNGKSREKHQSPHTDIIGG
jgi:hypothetical protein